MILKVISDLQKIENPIAEKLLAILSDKQEKVDETYYSSTIFESEENYNANKGYLTTQIMGNLQSKTINSPIRFVRSNNGSVFFSSESKGIAFGFTLVDYRTSKPLVIAVIDKAGAKYEYKSIMYDTASDSYIDSELTSKSCAKLETFLKLVIDNSINDADKWVGKK